eukprot:scaffold57249_cov35-Phaeocystis_antarctica.AAC.1
MLRRCPEAKLAGSKIPRLGTLSAISTTGFADVWGGNLSAKPSSGCLPAPSERPRRPRPSRIHQLGRW